MIVTKPGAGHRTERATRTREGRGGRPAPVRTGSNLRNLRGGEVVNRKTLVPEGARVVPFSRGRKHLPFHSDQEGLCVKDINGGES